MCARVSASAHAPGLQVFAPPSTLEPLPEGQVEMAKAAVSNLIGSMGYFYGSSQASTPALRAPGRPRIGLPVPWAASLVAEVPALSEWS